MEPLWNMDKKCSQSILQCLSISLVLRNIFQCISNADLFVLSLVNKLWNYEARSLMRDRGNVIARLNGPSCQDSVAAFMSHVEKLNIVPFRGISLGTWGHEPNCKSGALLDPSYDVILDRIQCKSLSISLSGPLDKLINCPTVLLAKKILELANGDMTLHLLRRERSLFLDAFQDSVFPGITTLRLISKMDFLLQPHDNEFVTKLVAQAPKLKEFRCDGGTPWEDVMGESSAVFVSEEMFIPALEADSVFSALRLTELYVDKCHPDFNVREYDRMISGVIRNSCTTLECMSVNVVFAVPLMCSGLCFKNVKTFTIFINYCSLESIHPRILSILYGFDFTRMFPNLKQVEVQIDMYELLPDQIIEAVKYGDARLKEPLPDRSVNIKSLSLSVSFTDKNVVSYFARMFPHIGSLIVNDYEGRVPYGLIWGHWAGLKEFHACGNVSTNLDSVFCGVFPEEIAELQEKDDEYLRMVHIVPVMPSVTCLRGLRALRICNATRIIYRPKVTEWPPMLTRVSRIVAFERCPALPSNLIADLLKKKALITDTSTPVLVPAFLIDSGVAASMPERTWGDMLKMSL